MKGIDVIFLLQNYDRSANFGKTDPSRLRELFWAAFTRSLSLVVMASGYTGGSDGVQPLDGDDESRYSNNTGKYLLLFMNENSAVASVGSMAKEYRPPAVLNIVYGYLQT